LAWHKEGRHEKNLLISVWMTIVTTILLGIIYPLVVTGLAQLIFPHRANGELIQKDGQIVGSTLIGQGFSSPGYFHSRPSAAGNGFWWQVALRYLPGSRPA
jgi:potassium-transporting ATPase KdpC subunit